MKIQSAAPGKTVWLRAGVHLAGLLPLAQLAYFRAADRLTANPILFTEQLLGRAALHLLVLTLAVTPVVALTGWHALARHRRTFGLYAFGYFGLHFLAFAVLDYGLDWGEILRLTAEKPFILAGLAAGLILSVLAVTSFDFWKKATGRNWKRLHRAVSLAGVLAVLHYALAVKGSLSTLSGNILRPLFFGLLVLVLLVLRLPPVRQWAARLRS